MAGYNRIIMVGNLTKDPDLRSAGTQSVCKLNIASNRQYKNKQTGNIVQEVCFIDIEVWGAQADSCKLYLTKGRPILVEGRLKLDSWKDTEGNTKSKHGIVAERVIFLNAGAEHGNLEEEQVVGNSANNINFDNNSSQKESIKKVKKSDTAFKDNAPFAEDDLPF